MVELLSLILSHDLGFKQGGELLAIEEFKLNSRYDYPESKNSGSLTGDSPVSIELPRPLVYSFASAANLESCAPVSRSIGSGLCAPSGQDTASVKFSSK